MDEDGYSRVQDNLPSRRRFACQGIRFPYGECQDCCQPVLGTAGRKELQVPPSCSPSQFPHHIECLGCLGSEKDGYLYRQGSVFPHPHTVGKTARPPRGKACRPDAGRDRRALQGFPLPSWRDVRRCLRRHISGPGFPGRGCRRDRDRPVRIRKRPAGFLPFLSDAGVRFRRFP